MKDLIVKEFKENAIYRMQESSRMIGIAIDKIGEPAVWKRPNGISNSIGNLILHLCGNIRQYAISSLGNLPDVRVRDEEFEAQEGFAKAELMDQLEQTVTEAINTINQVSEEELVRIRDVQGFQLSGIGIIMHVVEHYSYHTGQIAFWVKQLEAQDLGFYDGFDLNIKNE
ncbi:DinB family protein [Aureisphaera galaxeae]|uniref:DinB family protein n=1 Tax=Aureisphaera galaxeae TaxID=1538023 RepID=UPI002350BC4E|nr:DinB family protein [Aureisphaera galaxeae]MDC8004377.1 DinB family protein [Aureisphaera galaxeae]